MTKFRVVTISLWVLAGVSAAAYFTLIARGGEATPDVSFVVEEPADGSLPVLFEVPPFQLTDHRGQAFDSRSLEGRPWVGFVFLTACPTGACPVMVGKMGDLDAALGDLPVDLVGVTINPEQDTPEALVGYVERVTGDAPGDRWHLLTADSQAETLAVAEKLKLGVQPEDFTHSTQFLLIDAGGRVRGTYGNTDDGAMARLAADARALVEAGGQ